MNSAPHVWLGEAMPVEVEAWLCEPGEPVTPETVLAVVVSDKATHEVDAGVWGVLVERCAPVGASVDAEELLAVVELTEPPVEAYAASGPRVRLPWLPLTALQERRARASAPREPAPRATRAPVVVQRAEGLRVSPEALRYEIRVPRLGESVTEVMVRRWLKRPGEVVRVDEVFVEVDTDKVSFDLPMEVDGVLEEIIAAEDGVCGVGEVLAVVVTEPPPPPFDGPYDD